jgi:protocatechuate 4,5-dioxygenase alpha chain
MDKPTLDQPVPGTTIFTGTEARKGYALNKMCYSFNHPANRAEFLQDEDAYCAKLRPQRAATRGDQANATCST